MKVNIVDSMFGINYTGGLGMNNLNNGDSSVQNMIIDIFICIYNFSLF